MKDVKPQLRLAARFIKQSVKRISKTSKIEMLMKSMKIRMFRKRKKQLILYDFVSICFLGSHRNLHKACWSFGKIEVKIDRSAKVPKRTDVFSSKNMKRTVYMLQGGHVRNPRFLCSTKFVPIN